MDEQISYRINEIFNIVTTLRKQGEEHSVRFERLEEKLESVSGRQNDAISKVIANRKELTITSGKQEDVYTKIFEMWNRLYDRRDFEIIRR